MDRRSFLRTVALGAGALSLGPDFWRSAYAAPAQPGTVYGSLNPADANGLRLPNGFSSRVIARSGEVVGATGRLWHGSPDGGAVFATSDGGWIYVSNSEIPAGGGGVGAVRFDAGASIVSAHTVISGTSSNCAGGPTPWGTWLTCEETDLGQVYECNPAVTNSSVNALRRGLGTFKHEGAAVDPDRQHVFLTEDQTDGRFYRFTSAAWPDLNVGTLEAAVLTPVSGFDSLDPMWTVSWLAIPNPNILPGATPTRHQIAATTAFNGGEGIWHDSGHIYFTTKGDNRVWDYNATSATIALVYDDNLVTSPPAPLTGVDNIIVSTAGEIFVAEDGGDLQIVVIDANRDIEPFLQIVGHPNSEITGPAFDPSGTRLYFSSQRGTSPAPYVGFGITYEVSGPFRAGTNVPAVSDGGGLVSGVVHTAVEPPARSIDPALGDAVHAIDRNVASFGI